MATLGKRVAVPIIPGVMPLEDSTELDTMFFVDSDKIRFQNGKLRKVKGWQRIFSTNFQRIIGAARNIFSYTDQNGSPLTVVGTSYGLFSVIDNTFCNITPLQSNTTVIENSLSTEFNSGTYDVTTTAGSSMVSIDVFQYLNTNDLIQISGASNSVNGIPPDSFNGIFPANVISNSQIQINVGTPATSSGTVTLNFTWATSYVYVYAPANGQIKGARIQINNATGLGNIPATEINAQQIISNIVNPNEFVFQTGTIATSLITSGGGTVTTIQYQLAQGQVDQSYGFGYGVGLYGINNYGVQGMSNDVGIFPRIWSMDVYGSNLVLTPGDPATSTTDNLYAWNNDITVAPVLISSMVGASNVPLAVKWVYVSHDIVVTLGAAGIRNNFVASGSQNIENWTQDANTDAFSLIIQQAGPFISQGTSRNRDCIFTENEVYLVEFVDKPFIWNFRKLFTTDGIIGPKARAEVEDAIFWMGQGDFFIFDGTSVNVIPNNTLKRYVYDNINFSQGHKVVTFANVEYNEVWWFMPFGDDYEPNNYVKYNYKEGVWDLGTLNRSAAEEPLTIHELPWLIQSVLTNTVKVGNNIRTYFFSGADNSISDNPLVTSINSPYILINLISDAYLQPGDYIQISGAVDTNGIPASEINGVQQIVEVFYGNGNYAGGSLYGSGLYGDGLYSYAAPFVGSLYGVGDYGVGLYGYEGNPEFGFGYGDLGYGEGGYGGYELGVGYGSGLYGIGLYGISAPPDLSVIQILIKVTSNASSTDTGGGNAITIGTNIIGIDLGSIPGVDVGEVINVSGAQTVDGISGAYINGSNLPVRYIDGTTVQYQDLAPMTAFSTSFAVGGGTGAFITYTPSDRLFQHEYGNDDYNPDYIPGISPMTDQYAPMNAFAITNYAQIGDGDQTMLVYTMYPDSNQQGTMELTVTGRLYAQSPTISPTIIAGPFNITPTTQKVDLMLVARERQYKIQSNVLGGTFVLGKWQEEVKPSTTR